MPEPNSHSINAIAVTTHFSGEPTVSGRPICQSEEKTQPKGTDTLHDRSAAQFRREYRIYGQLGTSELKDRLSFTSLNHQLDTGFRKGYTEEEIVDATKRAVNLSLGFRSYLEGRPDLSTSAVKLLRKFLSEDIDNKNNTERQRRIIIPQNYSSFPFLWSVTDRFRNYLQYASHFTMYTDNDPLTSILTTARLNATGQRWVEELAGFRFTIKYRLPLSSASWVVDALTNYVNSKMVATVKMVLEESCGVNDLIPPPSLYLKTIEPHGLVAAQQNDDHIGKVLEQKMNDRLQLSWKSHRNLRRCIAFYMNGRS
ncbi:hypothetical protein HOLleu_39161 [Holothuria leucospilota]|uniref:Reverse transcriptase RNase H-like domain-containing protein n=1 Tax=Holothuria leucospilota TaxID=206669 RepID=A0A9Q0YFM3_HOLLE|nr:hypothetical protein HOLleu_39161 [Holothuria leucospilota]